MTRRAGEPSAGTEMTLSVCFMTAGPAARVAGLVALLRPVADELVVAVDDRAEPGVLAAADAADTVVRYPYREPVDRALPWLFSQCRGDWILNVDDDEVPSQALLDALPELLAAGDVTHYWLLRRWLWPDGAHAIAEHPWTTDYQLRLVVNDPRLLRFPSETHRPLEALGPHRFVREPLYHADCVVSPLERREAKARRYEALRPGKRIGGGPMNHVFHLPERRPGLRTEPLPDADAALVRAVLDAPPPTTVPTRDAPRAAAEEIDRHWSGRPLAEDDYRAELVLLDEPARMTAGEQRTFDVRVTNRGGVEWPWGERGEPEVRLSYHWLGPDGNELAHGLRTALPAPLPPGASQVVPLHVLAPEDAGPHRLRVELVHEHVRWFGPALEAAVEIDRRLRVALWGGADGVARALERLTEEAPAFEPLVLSSAPPPRVGHPHAPDLRRYLLEDTVHRRSRDVGLLAARSAELVRVAQHVRRREPVRPLLRGAHECLTALAGCTHLLLVAPSPEPGTRELWLQTATIEAARALGLEVVVQEGALADGSGPLHAGLRRRALAGARGVGPGELGLP